MTGPITKSVTVPLSRQRAFDLFTREISDWWPLDTHSLSASDKEHAISVNIPNVVGEQVIETRHDGTTAPWGRVTEWREGEEFAMRWHVGRPESQGTEVRVSFAEVADGTRVTVVHSNWQALGDEAETRRANYDTGWGIVLGLYAKAGQRQPATA